MKINLFPLILFLFFNNPLFSSPLKDVKLLEIENAPQKQKITLTRTFARNFYNVHSLDVIKTISDRFEEGSLTALDSIDFYFIRGRASYYAHDICAYNDNVDAARDLLNRYKGPKTELYYHIKGAHALLKARLMGHDGSPKDALQRYLTSLDYMIKAKDTASIAGIYRHIGSFYIDQKENEKAIEYLRKSLNTGLKKEESNSPFFNKVYAELIDAFQRVNKMDSARYYLQLIPPKQYTNSILFTVSAYYGKIGEPFKAVMHLDSILARVQRRGPPHWIPFVQMQKAKRLVELKEYEKAEALFLESRLSFMEAKDDKNAKLVSTYLYEYYKRRGLFEKALTFHEEVKMLNDSTLHTTHDQALKGIEANYSLTLKQKENNLLKEKEKINELTIRKQKWIGLLGLFCIAMLMLLVFVYVKAANTRKRLNNELKEANTDLSAKNQKISDFANELTFITDNFLEGVARLNENFHITSSDKDFKRRFDFEENNKQIDVFSLIGLPIEDATSLKEELINEGKTSFVWTGSDNGKIYQLKIENVGTARGIGTYLLIMEDVTKLKQAEADKFHQAEEAIKKLEVNFNQKQLETEELDSSLISKKKELAAKMMQISKRNADLEGILGNLKDLYKQSNSGTKLKLSKIINRLNNSLDIEDGWETFNTYFQEIHPCFLKELKERNNALTNNEVRHCTYIKLGLNNREVAQMLNVAPKTVEVTRYRIKKKLSLSNEESLSTYITAIS